MFDQRHIRANDIVICDRICSSHAMFAQHHIGSIDIVICDLICSSHAMFAQRHMQNVSEYKRDTLPAFVTCTGPPGYRGIGDNSPSDYTTDDESHSTYENPQSGGGDTSSSDESSSANKVFFSDSDLTDGGGGSANGGSSTDSGSQGDQSSQESDNYDVLDLAATQPDTEEAGSRRASGMTADANVEREFLERTEAIRGSVTQDTVEETPTKNAKVHGVEPNPVEKDGYPGLLESFDIVFEKDPDYYNFVTTVATYYHRYTMLPSL